MLGCIEFFHRKPALVVHTQIVLRGMNAAADRVVNRLVSQLTHMHVAYDVLKDSRD